MCREAEILLVVSAMFSFASSLSGIFVDIGARKLEYNVHGSGEAILVIETGMGCSWYD